MANTQREKRPDTEKEAIKAGLVLSLLLLLFEASFWLSFLCGEGKYAFLICRLFFPVPQIVMLKNLGIQLKMAYKAS